MQPFSTTLSRVYSQVQSRAELGARVDPRLVQMTRLFDEAWEIPGTNYRIGIDALVGIIPGIGDIATALLGRWMLQEAKRLGVPKHQRARIVAYYLVDLAVGAIPLVGDVFDATYKANKKSLAVIEKHLERRARATRRHPLPPLRR
jgi:hypothetical protein